jgi:hypothetical protein
MNPRLLPAARAVLLLAAPPALASPSGEVNDPVCGTATATGHSSTPVHWRLDVVTNHGSASDEAYGSAVVLAASADCWTDTCAIGVLYADGVEVARSRTVCV